MNTTNGTAWFGGNPAYKPAPVAACAECLGDCQQTSHDLWYCPACRHQWTFEQVAYFDDGGTADD